MSIELLPVTAENWKALIKLKLRDGQNHFVASNLYSIAEAQFGYEDEGHWSYYPFGVYVDKEPVGFVMYSFNFGHSRFQAFVTRLMVDEKYQGKGYARGIMKQVLGVFRADERVKCAGISYTPENEVARKLYVSLGFVEPGETIDGETLAILNLR